LSVFSSHPPSLPHLYPGKGIVHEPAVAAIIVAIAVDQLLLGEGKELAGLEGVGTLQRTRGGEGPARAGGREGRREGGLVFVFVVIMLYLSLLSLPPALPPSLPVHALVLHRGHHPLL